MSHQPLAFLGAALGANIHKANSRALRVRVHGDKEIWRLWARGLNGRCLPRAEPSREKLRIPARSFWLSSPLPSLQMRGGTGSLWDQAGAAPQEPGCYLFMANDGAVLYVGKALSLRNRVRSYLTRDAEPSASVGPRIAAMVRSAYSLELIATGTEAAALALESSLVREYRPPFNVLLKDDKRYPYILVTRSDEYPRVVLVRNPSHHRHKADRLYGPFVDEGMIKVVLRAINAAYPLRRRSSPLHHSRPCSNYDLGLCPGACQRLISVERYGDVVSQIEMLLQGRTTEVLSGITNEMKGAVEARDFEHAGMLRDRRNVILEANLLGEGLAEDAAAAASVADPGRADTSIAQDIVACAANAACGLAKVALFQVRSGCVIGRLAFTLHSSSVPVEQSNEAGADSDLAGASIIAALAEFYSRAGQHPMELPAEVVLATSPSDESDSSMLASALSAKRGKLVRVTRPGPRTRDVAALVVRNAEMELEIDCNRRIVVEQELRSVRQLLVPFFAPGALAEKLHRIECYDISHTSGTFAVGSMAVLIDGAPVHAENRVFTLDGEYSSVSTLGEPDDFASIAATLTLRLSSSSPLPDLIVIDGGKGQLSAAGDSLRGTAMSKIPIISLAKRAELVYVAGESEAVNEDIELGAGGVRVLCRARDEAHRAAVKEHVRKRGRAALTSGLDSVPGIGKARRAALLTHYPGGAAMVATANVEDLVNVPGISPALARRIVHHFKSPSLL
jgi:excinuclease ABC subunit C